MSPTMDQPRRAETERERTKPTGRRRAQPSGSPISVQADTAAAPGTTSTTPEAATAALPTVATPTTRAAARAAERERAARAVIAPAAPGDSGPSQLHPQPESLRAAEPATAAIPVVEAAQAAAPASTTPGPPTSAIPIVQVRQSRAADSQPARPNRHGSHPRGGARRAAPHPLRHRFTAGHIPGQVRGRQRRLHWQPQGRSQRRSGSSRPGWADRPLAGNPRRSCGKLRRSST